jgi:hypothetical protein
LLLVVVAAVSGCVVPFSLVAPGSVVVQDLTVQVGAGWNRAPGARTASARKGAETWTKDGMLLDRLVIIPAVPDGEPLLVSRNKSAALPVFRADMLPNELEELIESTILKLFGEGQAVVSTGNLRPHRYGANAGVMFNLSAKVTESPEYRGTVGAFIANENLYLMYFLGAVPHYYDKHITDAEAIIASATL